MRQSQAILSAVVRLTVFIGMVVRMLATPSMRAIVSVRKLRNSSRSATAIFIR
jgi:hypothetical protein